MGYKFQFVTLAGFHALNFSMFDLALDYGRSAEWPPTPISRRRNSPSEAEGYTATKHQREVGAGYFDEVTLPISGEGASTVALGLDGRSAVPSNRRLKMHARHILMAWRLRAGPTSSTAKS